MSPLPVGASEAFAALPPCDAPGGHEKGRRRAAPIAFLFHVRSSAFPPPRARQDSVRESRRAAGHARGPPGPGGSGWRRRFPGGVSLEPVFLLRIPTGNGKLRRFQRVISEDV